MVLSTPSVIKLWECTLSQSYFLLEQACKVHRAAASTKFMMVLMIKNSGILLPLKEGKGLVDQAP